MTKVIVSHHVADYGTWLPVFLDHGAVRRSHGATGHSVSRDPKDGNAIVAVIDFASLDGALAFAQDPSLPEAMHKGGVDGAPTVYIVNEADAATY